MTTFKRDIKEHNEGSRWMHRKSRKEHKDIRSKGDLGSHSNCFKCTKRCQRERWVTLCGDPESRTMTTVWAFSSLLQWIISTLNEWSGIMQISIRQEVSFYPQSILSRKWLKISEISGVQLFIIFVVTWMWWLTSWSESEEQKLTAAVGKQEWRTMHWKKEGDGAILRRCSSTQ